MATGQTGTLGPAGTPKGAVSRLVAAWMILPLFFVATGGSLRWWEAWIYCAELLVPMTLFLLRTARRDPAFLARRFKLREKERSQRRFLAWGAPFLLAALIIPGFDRRYGWSEPPVAAVATAMVVVLAGYLLVLRVFVENRWAGRTVETYEGQQVVSTGPYAMVRHPMYAGAAALYLATPVALGSWWAALPAFVFVLSLTLRIRNEEEVLLRELPRYEDYRRSVRYRLVPFIW